LQNINKKRFYVKIIGEIMDLIISLSLVCIVLIIIIFLIRNLEWITKEIRNICEDESGYMKLIQLIFVILVLASFFILLVFNLVFRESTSKLDIFLTVIVGLMGTIIGTFFSERSMETIKKDRDKKRKAIIQKTIKLKEYKEALDKLLKRL
jgi:magnesium-transporting ATPase (P-type)